MAEPGERRDAGALLRDAERGDRFRVAVEAADIETTVAVLVPEPAETTQVGPGAEQVVFTHPSGRTIGMNLAGGGWDRCLLVAEDDSFQHALVVRGETVEFHTRDQPGRPDDWEHRGTATVEPLPDERGEDAGSGPEA